MIMAIGAAAGAAIGGIAASAGATAATVAAVTAVSVAAVNGLIIGAVVGAATSAITGGDILKGALIGGGIGAVTGGFGEWLSPAAGAAGSGGGGAIPSLEAAMEAGLPASTTAADTLIAGAGGVTPATAAASTGMTAGLPSSTTAADALMAQHGGVSPGAGAITGATAGEVGIPPAGGATGATAGGTAGGTAGAAKGGLISSITGADSFTKAMLISGGMQALGSGITAATQPDQEALLEKNAALAEQGRIAAMSQPGSVLNRWKQILDRSTISDAYSRYKINTGATTVSKPLATKTGLLAEGGAA